MAKRDFMSELAQEATLSKQGKEIKTMDDYQLKKSSVSTTKTDTSSEIKETPKEIKKKTVIEDPGDGEIPLFVDEQQKDGQQEYENPSSFDEEERVRIEKPKRKLKKSTIILLTVLAVVTIAILIYVLFFPKITMPDFVGKTKSDVSSWATQYKIESTSIALKEEYSLEYAEDEIIEQSVKAGKKIKTTTPITLTVSIGADPDEHVDVPDIMNSTIDELKEWVETNQLSKTKITTEYSTSVVEGDVISYEMKNVSEEDFTRGSTLTIKCSKGPAPAGKVTVENYEGKTYSEAELWATNKKLKVEKIEENSQTVDSGKVISQSPASGTSMSEGETITFIVSKGEGVKVPNLVGYTKEQLAAWQADSSNKVTVVTKSVWDESPEGSVIEQSITAGTTVDEGTVLELTVSLYLPILETNSQEWIGKNYLELKAWCDKVNAQGADIQAGEYGDYAERVYSDTVEKDGIVAYACEFGTSSEGNGCERPLNLNARISYQVSLGPKPSSTSSKDIVITTDALASLSSIQSFCSTNGLACTFTEDSSVTNVEVTFQSKAGSSVTKKTGDSLQEVITSSTSIAVKYNANPTTP